MVIMFRLEGLEKECHMALNILKNTSHIYQLVITLFNLYFVIIDIRLYR